MQTFLPYPDYLQSMRTLDKSRLGNQVWREGITLIRGKWKNHPASKMWRGHEYHLGLYLLAGVQVLSERGKHYEQTELAILAEMAKHRDSGPPAWLGDSRFHDSHKASLLKKKFDWYSQFGWSVPDVPLFWPV
jgi:hypothetical protein